MAQRDTYHGSVRRALEADGWIITDDPLSLKYGTQTVFVDLGAETALLADKDGRKIAVEVKSFLGVSQITDLEQALGQYSLYRVLMEEQDRDRTLYLAIPKSAYMRLLDTKQGQTVLRTLSVRVLVFDIEEERIEQWIE